MSRGTGGEWRDRDEQRDRGEWRDQDERRARGRSGCGSQRHGVLKTKVVVKDWYERGERNDDGQAARRAEGQEALRAEGQGALKAEGQGALKAEGQGVLRNQKNKS